MRYGILAAVIIYEIVTIFGIGWWVSRNHKKDEAGAFALAGRDLPLGVVAATMALTVLGTAHILGVFEMTWFMGASAIWFSIAHVVLLVVVCLSTGLWVRRLEVTTVPELLERMYGKGTRLLVSCVMAAVIWGILTLETQGIGIVLSSMTGWSIKNGAIVGGILGIFYVIMAGMKEVGWINLVNAVIMYIGLVLATVFLAFKLPGGNFDTVANFYTDAGEGFMLNIVGSTEILITFALANIVSVTFCQGISQMLLQTCMSAKSEQTIKKALWIAAPVNGLFGVFAVVIGLTARTLPEFSALGPKVAATTMLVELLPGWVCVVLLASFLAAILSTFAMTSLTPATIFAVDIYKNLFNPNATEQEVTKVTRIAIIILSVIAMAIAAFLPPILSAINWLFAWLVPVFWLVVFGLFWKRSAKTAIATLLASWIINSLWSFTPLPAAINMADIPNGYVTLVVTFVVAVIMNLGGGGKPAYFKSEEYLLTKKIG